MNYITVMSLTAALAASSLQGPPKSPSVLGVGGRTAVLIVSGNDSFHDWRRTTPQLRIMLEDTGKFDVRVVEDFGVLESCTTIGRYRAIILNGQTNSSSGKLRNCLRGYVHRGGGLVAIHWAVDNFHDWPAFTNVLGRSWQEGRSIEEHGSFVISPTPEAERTIGTIVPWATPQGEAIHYQLKGFAPIRVVATTNTPQGGKDIPAAFVHQFGKGRTFFTPLGHSAVTRADPAFQTLIVQAVNWVSQRP
jgi:Trehalose utilisation